MRCSLEKVKLEREQEDEKQQESGEEDLHSFRV